MSKKDEYSLKASYINQVLLNKISIVTKKD